MSGKSVQIYIMSKVISTDINELVYLQKNNYHKTATD